MRQFIEIFDHVVCTDQQSSQAADEAFCFSASCLLTAKQTAPGFKGN